MVNKKSNLSIMYFVIITFLLSWPFMLYGYGFTESILARDIFAMIGMIMVTVSALIVRLFFENKNFKDIYFSKGKLKWYLAVLGIFLLYYLLPYVLESIFGSLNVSKLLGERKIVFILSLTVAYLAAFGEEFGWRGFLQKRLIDKSKKTLDSLIIVGIIWGIWHFPIALGPFLKEILANSFTMDSLLNTVISCAQMIGAAIALSFIFGYTYLKYKSIYFNSFIHFLYIGIRDASLLLFGFTVFSLPISLIIMIIMFIVSYKWINEKHRSNRLL